MDPWIARSLVGINSIGFLFLTHWGRDKMADISLTVSNTSSWMKIYEFWSKISLKFIPKGLINNIPALVQIMAWCWPDDKPLSEPVVVRLPTHICITRLNELRNYDLCCNIHVTGAQNFCEIYLQDTTKIGVFIIYFYWGRTHQNFHWTSSWHAPTLDPSQNLLWKALIISWVTLLLVAQVIVLIYGDERELATCVKWVKRNVCLHAACCRYACVLYGFSMLWGGTAGNPNQ